MTRTAGDDDRIAIDIESDTVDEDDDDDKAADDDNDRVSVDIDEDDDDGKRLMTWRSLALADDSRTPLIHPPRRCPGSR